MAHFHIADDHPLFRTALTTTINANFENATITESFDLDSTLSQLESFDEVDLLLLDLNMPGSQDLYGLLVVRDKFPSVPVAVISASESDYIVQQSIAYGASGFIPKSSQTDQLSEAINHILAGEKWLPADCLVESEGDVSKDLTDKVAQLTPQQYRVLCLIREGWLNKQIAYELGVTEATIKAHVTAIFKKLEVTNRTQAVVFLSKIAL